MLSHAQESGMWTAIGKVEQAMQSAEERESELEERVERLEARPGRGVLARAVAGVGAALWQAVMAFWIIFLLAHAVTFVGTNLIEVLMENASCAFAEQPA